MRRPDVGASRLALAAAGLLATTGLALFTAASGREPDPEKRKPLVNAALKEHNAQVCPIPLLRQVIPWAARQNVERVHRADNGLEWRWITIK